MPISDNYSMFIPSLCRTHFLPNFTHNPLQLCIPGIYCLTKLTIMAILFELNSYALKSFAPIELGLGSIEHAETRIQNMQRYFHIFFIPILHL